MQLYHDDAHGLISAEKELFDFGLWGRKENRDKQTAILHLVCRVKVGSALPQGLRFRVITFPEFPNKATFQLEIERPPKRDALTLYRLDWHPATGHANGRNGPEELWDLLFEPLETHEHICIDHLSPVEMKVLSGGVQAARKIDPDFNDFPSAFQYVCDRLNIVNGNKLPERDAQADLF